LDLEEDRKGDVGMKLARRMTIRLAHLALLVVLVTIGVAACGGSSTPPSATPTPPSITPVEPVATSQPSQSNLEAVLQVPTTLPDGGSVELEFTLINNSESGLYVLKWYTPLEGIAGEIFYVKRDGQPIPYEGLLATRGDPPPDAYVFLDSGASVSATVDLATAYDFSEPGEYTIAFISPRISHVARTEDQMATSVEELGPVQIPSNRVTVHIEGYRQ
jgi:ABC-type glycerol-3-phosphate transport system substrate-binding protein